MFVDVAFVNTALVAVKVLVVLVSVKSPPMPTLPVTVALLAVKFATVVEPAESVPRFVAPETERLSVPTLLFAKVPPEIVGLLIWVLFSWSIALLCAVTT